jgi:hypothetical protein
MAINDIKFIRVASDLEADIDNGSAANSINDRLVFL